jgi:hypothetical protein
MTIESAIRRHDLRLICEDRTLTWYRDKWVVFIRKDSNESNVDILIHTPIQDEAVDVLLKGGAK